MFEGDQPVAIYSTAVSVSDPQTASKHPHLHAGRSASPEWSSLAPRSQHTLAEGFSKPRNKQK